MHKCYNYYCGEYEINCNQKYYFFAAGKLHAIKFRILPENSTWKQIILFHYLLDLNTNITLIQINNVLSVDKTEYIFFKIYFF